MIQEIKNHRSIRHFDPRPIPDDVMQEALLSATRASTTGNMQLYSIIVTTDGALRAEVAPCHFGQSAATEAAAIVTFCADVHRFSLWCRQRGADPGYDNFQWFINGAIDATLASANFALEAEAHGLGICYLGTTTYNAADIIRILKLPQGVVPIVTLAVGYPTAQQAELPLTDRLPLEAVVHRDTYRDYTPSDIDHLWHQREQSDETAQLLQQNDLPNLARIFTERRYTKADAIHFSQEYLEVLKSQNMF